MTPAPFTSPCEVLHNYMLYMYSSAQPNESQRPVISPQIIDRDGANMTTSVDLERRLFIDGRFEESISGRRDGVIKAADESDGFREYLQAKTIASPAKS